MTLMTYNAKIVECSGFENALDATIPTCDQAQLDMRAAACEASEHAKISRHDFADGWHRCVHDNTGTWPVNADSLTAQLCPSWCDVPVLPDPPEPLEGPCTPAYIAKKQGSFLAAIQTL